MVEQWAVLSMQSRYRLPVAALRRPSGWRANIFASTPGEWKGYRYDVKTLAYLDKHEVREGAFAHLCKYEYGKEPEPEGRGIHFYRICLQDDRILNAIERATPSSGFRRFCLYIAAHELVHVIRFDRGRGEFRRARRGEVGGGREGPPDHPKPAQAGQRYRPESGPGVLQRPLPDR